MTANTYDQRLARIVKQNETLKFALKKQAKNNSALLLMQLFAELFPDIPPFPSRMSALWQKGQSALGQKGQGEERVVSMSEVVGYYRATVGLCLQKDRIKLQLFQSGIGTFNSPSAKHINIKLQLPPCHSHSPKQSQPDLISPETVQNLQKQLSKKQAQVQQLQQAQEEYIKQIACLRSITKKLQYQLAVNYTKMNTIQSAYKMEKQNHLQVVGELEQEVKVWMGEYQRLYMENHNLRYQEESAGSGTKDGLRTWEGSKKEDVTWGSGGEGGRNGDWQHVTQWVTYQKVVEERVLSSEQFILSACSLQ